MKPSYTEAAAAIAARSAGSCDTAEATFQVNRCAGATVVTDVVVVMTWPDDGGPVLGEVITGVVVTGADESGEVATDAVTAVNEPSDDGLDGVELLVDVDELVDVPVTGGTAPEPELHAAVTLHKPSTGNSSPTPARVRREGW